MKLNKNLLLKVSLNRSFKRKEANIPVKVKLREGNFCFSVGYDYHPATLVINTGGTLFINSGKNEFTLPEGTSLVLNSGTKYRLSYQSPHSTNLLFVFLTDDFIGSYFNSYYGNDEFNSPLKEREMFFEKVFFDDKGFYNIGKPVIENFDKYLGENIFEDGVFNSFVSKLYENQRNIKNEMELLGFRKKSTREEIYKRINKAHEYLFCSTDRNVSIDEISKQCALSKFYLIRLFKDIYNVTPIEMHTSLRINKAKELLKDENKNITDICFEVGYNSLSTFSLLFKKQTGHSPNRYRKLQLNIN